MHHGALGADPRARAALAKHHRDGLPREAVAQREGELLAGLDLGLCVGGALDQRGELGLGEV